MHLCTTESFPSMFAKGGATKYSIQGVNIIFRKGAPFDLFPRLFLMNFGPFIYERIKTIN